MMRAETHNIDDEGAQREKLGNPKYPRTEDEDEDEEKDADVCKHDA
jgi:hypothetical protein